jgi:RHS repeat-associated protein
VKRLLTIGSAALLLACPAFAQLTLPAQDAGNFDECFNSDGDGVACSRNQQRSGSWITGDSDGENDVVLTDEGTVIIPTGSFYKHVLDYRALFNQGDPVCGPEPIVETPHHTPFVLEFSRYFRTRASYIDYGLSKGWKENYFFLLNITSSPEYRVARIEVPSGAEMNWIDVGLTGNWSEDNDGAQSMVLTLTDEPGDEHLVTDRWGGKYHFVPNTTTRPFLQYLINWLEDENGNRITLTYNANGYPILAADGFGRFIHYTWTPVSFNGTRHIARVVLPSGQILQLQHFFDSPQTYTLTYPNGDVASYGFGNDADGDFYYFNDPLAEPGARKQRVYTYGTGPTFEIDTGRVRGIKDESGHVQLARYEEPAGPSIHIEYDDGRGYQYDCALAGLNGRVTNLRTGAVTTNEWQRNGCLLKTKVDPLGSWLTADYDDLLALRVLRHNLDTSADTWTYGANNRVVDHVDPNGNVTHYDYDSRGNLVKKTYADTTYDEWTRHASGRVTDYRNRNGLVTSYQYDAHGNVSAIVLPAEPSEANPVVAYQYDVDGRVLSKTDPVGRITTYQYDSLGRRVSTTHPDGSSEQVVFGTMDLPSPTDPVSTAGLVVSRTDRNGNVTSYEYGANDRLVRESGALGEIVYTYDATDRLVARSENGDGESYGYDSAYRRTTLTRDVDATHVHVSTYQYDLLDRVVETVDPHGFTTQTSYYPESQVGSVVRQIDGSATAATTYSYDPNGNLLTEDNGNLRSYVYDSNDRRVRAYDPAPFDTNYVEYTYDAEGQLLSRRDQEGNTSSFGYSNRGRLSLEMDPTGVTVLHEYNLDDTLARTSKPATLGERTFVYDTGGRQAGGTVVVDGAANDITTTESHDGKGNVLQRVDGEGGVYAYEYDGRDRVIRSVDPLGEETLTAYSDDGAPFDPRLAAGQGGAVTVTDPNGRTKTTVYDGVGRVMREIDELGASTVFTRDVPSAGRVGVLRTDRMGRTTAEYHDGIGRLVQSTDELNHATQYVYDLQDNLTRIVDARGKETSYTCDALGRLTGEELPELGDIVAFTYRANGLLDERIDQQGNHTQYGYDAAGRRVSVLYQDGSTDTFVHDAGGRLVQAASGQYGNTVTFAYDRADRLIRDGSSGQVHLTYDRRSLETGILTPSGREFVNTYTGRGELDTISLDAGVLVDNAYDADGRLVQREFGNGTSSSWERDAHGWVSAIHHTRGASDFLHLMYTRDGEGRMLRQRNFTNTSRSETYVYDAAGRLVSFRGKVPPVREAPPVPTGSEKGVSKMQEWVLDQVGNWSQFTHNGTHEFRLHTDSNELVGISGFGNLVYDKRGNLVDDGVQGYVYDYNNQLKSVHKLSNDELVADYSYDALGRRLGRTFVDKSAITIRRLLYCYAGERIVEMRVKPTVDDPDQFLAAFAHGTEPDQPLVMVRQNQTYSFHHNAGGSTVALTNESGNTAERYEYDPYGGTRVFTGIWAPIGTDSAVGNPFTFQCRENDAEVGLIFFRERNLSPNLGRYLQRNPAGQAGGVNLYSASSLVNGRSPHALDD